jgi:transportin-1
MGNGLVRQGRGTDIPGLAENAAACVGRLAKANVHFVAPELPRFLPGWCEGMAKIVDPAERRDAFEGFIHAVYTNPHAIQQASDDVAATIASILFAVLSWHLKTERKGGQSLMLSNGECNFHPFPPQESDLGAALAKLVQDIKSSVSEDVWHAVEKELPVQVRKLLRESYQL